MFDDVEFEKQAAAFVSALPAELQAAIAAHGFAKVASALSGLDLTNERVVYQKIGQDLFTRIAERRAINRGLTALTSVEE